MAYGIFEKDYDMNIFTKTEKIVFYYLLKNQNKISQMTASSVAQNCFCTTTTVNRLCKKMKVDGFSDLKAIISYEAKIKGEFVTNEEIANLDNFYNFKVDIDEIRRFIDKLSFEHPIYIHGAGSSSISAQYLARMLLKIGFESYYIEDRYLLAELMKHQVILISNSGETASCLNLANTAQSKNVQLFSFTKKNSTLEKVSTKNITHNLDYQFIDSYIHEQQINILKLINYFVYYLNLSKN